MAAGMIVRQHFNILRAAVPPACAGPRRFTQRSWSSMVTPQMTTSWSPMVLSSGSQLRHPQSQRITDDADRRQRHGRSGNDRREQDTEGGIQDSGGDRDAGDVIDERKE